MIEIYAHITVQPWVKGPNSKGWSWRATPNTFLESHSLYLWPRAGIMWFIN